jgi:3-dehydrotetronate 4-kinase
MKTDFTIATPAFPDNGRTVFKGHLFVGDQLLSDSGMKDHPLTPMRDANLVRVLQAQTNQKVGLVDHKIIAAGAAAIAQKFSDLRTQGVGMAIVDAVSNQDLVTLGKALKGMPLVTAGSGVAIGLAQNFDLSPSAQASALPAASGFKAIVSGSCSLASNQQVAHFKQAGLPSFGIDPTPLMQDQADVASLVAQIRQWAKPLLNQDTPILIYATADAQTVSRLQQQCDAHLLGSRIEQLLGKVAQDLVEDGVGQLIVAGGETSGACVQALAIEQMQIGPQIDPGVPWCFSQLSSAGPRSGGLHLTLKSGNFGTDDFFTKAFKLL